MPQRSSLWSRLTSEKLSAGASDGAGHLAPQSHPDDDRDNPWLTIPPAANAVMSDRHAQATTTLPQDEAPRWLSDVASPYGFSDDDGTLKQLDSTTWRRAFGTRRSKRTVDQMGSRGAGQTDPRGVLPTEVSAPGSLWLMQTACAVAIVAGGFYAAHGQSRVAQQLHDAYQRTFSTDFESTAAPAVRQFLQSHQLTIPTLSTLWPSTAIRFHVPLSGTITADYSARHPTMTIAGQPDEAVLAAGSGTVNAVAGSGVSYRVTLDHGAMGTSTYSGLGVVSVQRGEYVQAGEIIGRLPQRILHPVLTFAMEQSNRHVNPHDFIEFPPTSA